MSDYLLDTSILIEILRNNPTVLARLSATASAEHDVQINALSYYETRRGLLDILIAAMALVNDAVLVTDNVSHFKRVAGLKLENWV